MSFEKSTNTKPRAYLFSLEIIRFVKDFPREKVYAVFQDQLLRSVTSVGANMIEAKASSSKKDFIKYYQIALKSCNESQYWLCLLRDAGLSDKTIVAKLLQECREIGNMLGASVISLKSK